MDEYKSRRKIVSNFLKEHFDSFVLIGTFDKECSHIRILDDVTDMLLINGALPIVSDAVYEALDEAVHSIEDDNEGEEHV